MELEEILYPKPLQKGWHDKLVEVIGKRLKKSNLYELIEMSADIYKDNGIYLLTDVDDIAKHKDRIIYVEGKCSWRLHKKAYKQLKRAKEYFNKNLPECKFYGFMVWWKDKKHKEYKIKRIC